VRHPLLKWTSFILVFLLCGVSGTAPCQGKRFCVVPWCFTAAHTLKIFTRESFSKSLVSTGEVDVDRTTDTLLLQKTESSPKVKMSNVNCSTQPKDSELQNSCKGNGQDQVPISPVGKVAALGSYVGRS